MHYTKHNLSDTIVALATPPGVGAIGVIRLSGLDALTTVQKVFSGKDLTQQKSHTLHFGTIKNDDGKILDEVLASIFIAPHSYTGGKFSGSFLSWITVYFTTGIRAFDKKRRPFGAARRVHHAGISEW